MPNSINDEFPTIMNGTEIPFSPSTWERTPNKIQNLNQSEGGRDIIQKIRSDKMSISVSYAIADYVWVQFFEQLNELDSFVVREYSPRLNGYRDMTCRMEGFTDNTRRKSQKLASVKGIWEVSFTLEEF